MIENSKGNARERMAQALIELMNDTKYYKIKVSDIIRLADVNRSTFYRNFDDIYDMFRKICNVYIDYVIEPVKMIKNVNPEDRIGIFKYIKEYRDYIENCLPALKILTSENGDLSLFYDLRDALCEETERIADEILENNHMDIKLFCNCISNYFPTLVLMNCINPISLDKFENHGFEFDCSKSFVDNALYLITLVDSDYDIKIMKKMIVFIFNCWQKKEFSPNKISELVKVTEVMKHIGISRTMFYKKYENMSDMVRFYYSVFAYVFSEYLNSLLSSNIEDVHSLLRNKDKEKSLFKRNILLDVMKTPVFLSFASSTVGRTIKLIEEKVISRKGELNDSEKFCIEFYVISMITIFFDYLKDFDTEEFISKLNVYYEKLKDDNVDLS